MPLSKARMRERKRLDRVKPKSNLIQTYDSGMFDSRDYELVKPSEPHAPPIEPLYRVGSPARPTQSQKAEWAKFKAGQR